jgi:hypothetical protein
MEQEEQPIEFFVKLRHEDYDAQLRGWHCSVLRIPGATIKAIYGDQGMIVEDEYKISFPAQTIRFKNWVTPPTDDITLQIELKKKLSSPTKVAWIGVLSAILGGLATGVASLIFGSHSNDRVNCADARPPASVSAVSTVSAAPSSLPPPPDVSDHDAGPPKNIDGGGPDGTAPKKRPKPFPTGTPETIPSSIPSSLPPGTLPPGPPVAPNTKQSEPI